MGKIVGFFTGIKDWIIGFFALLSIGLWASLKWKSNRLEEKKEKIEELKKQVKLNKNLADANMKINEYNVRQKVKKEILEKEFKNEKELLEKYKSNPPINRKFTV